MILRVDLPEGPFLADVGFGHQTATLPLRLQPGLEQQTLHEAMRLRPASEELVLEARLAGSWQHLYRFSLRPTPDIDYEVGNWFCATYPGLVTENLIVARAGAERMRHTFLNGRVTVRRDGEVVERRVVEGERALAVVLAEPFLLICTRPVRAVLGSPKTSADLGRISREGDMNAKTFLTIAAVVAVLFGLALVLAPTPAGSVYGIPADPHTALALQFFGSVLIGIAIVNWFAKDFGDWEAIRGVLIANAVGDAVGGGINLLGTFQGLLNGMAWTSTIVYAALLIGSLYCLSNGGMVSAITAKPAR